MDRERSQHLAVVVAMVVAGVVVALAIAVNFDSPTSVFLLAALALAFALFAIYSSQRGKR